MKILALGTATAACSSAVWRDGEIVASERAKLERGHAEALIPMIARTVSAAGFTFGDVDAVAVTVGPGAFTGLRVGLAAARGLALAMQRPCLGVTTLEAVAKAVSDDRPSDRPLLVTLDTKRGDFYAQSFFADGTAAGDPVVASPSRLAEMIVDAPVVVAGDAATRAVAALAGSGIDAHEFEGPRAPDARFVAAIAARRWQGGERGKRPPAPLYLRPPEAVVPKAAGRRRS